MTSRSSDDEWDEPDPPILYPAVPQVDWTPPEVMYVLYSTDGEELIVIEAPRNPIGFT